MSGVPRELFEHGLNVDPKARPVKQPLRRFDEPKRKAIVAELHCLKNAGFIKEIKTFELGVQPNHCSKEEYRRLSHLRRLHNVPSTNIDLRIPSTTQDRSIIDSTAGCARLSFLDAYSGYNQIKLKWKTKKK
jgi:hypothetical protein